MFTFSERTHNQRVYRLASELEKRVSAIESRYPYRFAEHLLPVLLDLAPKDIPGYREHLRVTRYRIPGLAGVAAIGLPAYARHQQLQKKDAPRTVLYVQPKVSGKKAVDPGSVVLWRNNPWTMETLPYEPSGRVATIVSRRVSEKAVKKIEAIRALKRDEVDRELRDLGITITRKFPVLLERRVIRDLAYEVLRREFGLGDAPHVAHWRPALRYAKTILAKRTLKEYLRWLTVPSEQRWRRPFPSKPGRLSDLRRVQGFQAYIRP